MKYVALLRGINVGGNNKVNMGELRLAMEDIGLRDVKTYINSGNVLFSSDTSDTKVLSRLCELATKACSGVSTTALVIDQERFMAIAGAINPSYTNDQAMKCDVMFLWDSVDSEQVLELLTIRESIDTVMYVPGALVWSVAKSNVTKSGLLRIVGTPLYAQMTIRNCNTARKLAAMLESTD